MTVKTTHPTSDRRSWYEEAPQMTEQPNDQLGDRADMEVQLSIYETLASRRASYDTMMWQAPMLSLTAQAFLFTIALGPGSARIARILASMLSFISAVGSMHLMAKQHFNEGLDNRVLYLHEERLNLPRTLGRSMHDQTKRIAEAIGYPRPWFVRQSSYRLWMLILALFATAALSVLLITFFHSDLLE
jgi:hypothetical protein